MNIETLHTTVQNKIATISFFHPASNSLSKGLLEKLTNEFCSLDKDDSIRVIILKSEGEKAFCGGAFFDDLLKISTAEEGFLFFKGFANLINAMRNCTKIIIGKIHGKTVGGGVGLAATCDYCIATEKASVKLSELFIGIGAFVIEPAVERKIGKAAFCQLSLEATDWHSANWAKDKGLFTKVFETFEKMNEEVETLAKKIANYNPIAMTQMKKIFWENTENWEQLLIKRAKISGDMILSEFAKKTLSKFKK